MQPDLALEFQRRFHKQAEHFFFCPGRLNLIGEHLDYNGGKVMPCAITLGTFLAVSRNTDKLFRFQSLNYPEQAELHLQLSYSKSGKEWFNYPLGVIHQFFEDGFTLSGLDMLFYGDLPIGAGLSSSASIEVLTAFALNEIFLLNVARKDLALTAQKVENEFIGVNCGIMDQFAVALGKKDKAIWLDCDNLNYEYLPFETGNYVLVILNSNKSRSLADSKYNQRFAECGAALKLLKAKLDRSDKQQRIENLCDMDMALFEANRDAIEDPVLEKRARHVISENERVRDAASALMNNDLKVFGQLMFESHRSLKQLYEVSGLELDTLVEFCENYEACIGARMTGAGFGGCAIALVEKESLSDFSEKLIPWYKERVGYQPTLFVSGTGDGVRMETRMNERKIRQ